MPNKTLLTTGLACLLVACSDNNQTAVTDAVDAQSESAAIAMDCENAAGAEYLCGVSNGEDILQLGNSNWLLVSGMDGSLSGSDVRGRIHLVNAAARSVDVLFPGSNPVFQHDMALYGNCPGPLDTLNFSAHGLALQKIDKGPEIYRLYMTSHGAREAIEVFEVDAFIKPTLKWVGCIPMPATSWTNSVAILNDGGFVATQFFDPGSHTIENVLAGEITGHVFEWHPGGEVSMIAGTELSGPNGIAISDDERWIFVAAFGTSELVRFDRSSTPVGKESVALDVVPDNVRWTSEGNLYVAGNNTPDYCGKDNCEPGWSVFAVTPYNLTTERVAGMGEDSALHDASSALLVNNEIWVGTYSGDRLVILPR